MAEIDAPLGAPLGVPRPRLTRGAGVLGVLAVVAGFGGGFAAGYAAHDEPDRSAVAAVATDDAGDEAGDEADSTPGGTIAPSAASSSETATTSAAAVSSGPLAAPVPPTRLFRRTTADGYSVRVFRNDMAQGVQDCAADVWCPPVECNPASYVEAQVVGDWSVAQGGAPWWPLRDDQPARILGTIAYWYSDDPVFGVIVRTSAAVSNARLAYAGHEDEMEPIDGLAVLAVPDPNLGAVDDYQPYPRDATIEVVVDGSVVPVALADVFEADPACVPPPPAPAALPPAGEQPADVATAEAAVRAVFRQAFGGDDADANANAVDDPAGLAEIREELRERYPEMLGGRVTYEITDVVFTSPDAAAYYFRPVIEDYGEFLLQVGRARIVEGEWKITRGTVCAMFSLGGATC